MIRHGDTNSKSLIHYETIEGSATPGEDYIAQDSIVEFLPGETKKVLTIVIIDDNDWEPDETFFVKLSLPTDDESKKINSEKLKVGKKKIAQITILNDDGKYVLQFIKIFSNLRNFSEPGTFSITQPSFLIPETCGDTEIPIKRENGCDGDAVISWRVVEAEGMSAVPGEDFAPASGVVNFIHAQQSGAIKMTIFNKQAVQKDLCFQIEIFEVSEGAKIGSCSRTVVTIVDDEEFSSLVKRVVTKTHLNLVKFDISQTTDWKKQIEENLNVNGGDWENASAFDYGRLKKTIGVI